MRSEAFIEEWGLIAEGEGLPRIAGRIRALLLLSEDALGFGEIAERLGVSRASTSTNLRLLVERGMIERTSLPGDRRDYYRTRDTPHGRAVRSAIQRLDRMAAALAAVRAEEPLAGAVEARLDGLQQFLQAAADSLRDLVRRFDVGA